MNNYRSDIDGLRAIAVLVIIFFHYEIPYFKGGFVGVDIFFVISGYLISSIIFSDLAKNQFSFVVFYERRIRRILPALYLVLSFSTIIAFILFNYEPLLFFGNSLVATVLFASNFYFRTNSGYFATPSQQIPLLHTWSLAVEEQFYLLFPIIIYFLYKYQATKIKYYIIGGILLSFALCIILSETYTTSSFYLLPTRAWEFLTGALIAIRLFPRPSNTKVCNSLSILGIGFIIVAVFMLSSATKYPSYYALLPVLGTSLLLYSGENNEQVIINKILGLRFFVFIGKISYSLYLWHWVLFVFYKYILIVPFNSFDISMLLIVTFILSILSWRFIEQRFRSNRFQELKIKRKNVFLGTLGISILFIFVGIYNYKNKGMMPWRFLENKFLMEAQQDSTFDNLVKHREAFILHPDDSDLPCIIGDKDKVPHVIIWGDSHAKCLGSGLNAIAKENNGSFYIAEFGNSIPLQQVDRITNSSANLPSMSFVSKKVLQFIVAHKEIKTVLLVGRWCMYVGHGNQYDTPVELSSTNEKWKNDKGNNFLLFENGLRETINALNAAKRRIILVTDVPQLNVFPSNLVTRRRYTGENLNNMTPKRAIYESNNSEILSLFEKFKKEKIVDEILPLHEQFFMNNKTIIEENNHLLFRDDNHLSYWGSMKIRGLFSKYIKNGNEL